MFSVTQLLRAQYASKNDAFDLSDPLYLIIGDVAIDVNNIVRHLIAVLI